jgi:tetratricopeptide (TPR) repeat protein
MNFNLPKRVYNHILPNMLKLRNLLILLFCTAQLSAQNRIMVDSLFHLLKTEKRDTQQANIYNQLAWEYRNADIQLTDSFATIAITKSEKAGYCKGTGTGYMNRSFVFRNSGNYQEAIKANRWALVQFVQCDYKRGFSSVYNNIAGIHSIMSNHSTAQFYYFQSLKISEQLGDDKGIARSLNNIGVVNMAQKHFDKALHYYNRCTDIMKRLGDENGMADCLNNMGNIYQIRDNYDLAVASYQRCADINRKLGDRRDESSALHNIGLLYTEKGDYKNALNYYHQSLIIDEKLGDIGAIIVTHGNIADCYIKMKMYHAALKYAKESLTMALAFGMKTNIMNAYSALYKIEEINKNYKQALIYHEKYKQYSDSIYNVETNEKVEVLEEQYNREKSEKEAIFQSKEAEIKLIKTQEKEHAVTQYIFIIGLVLIIFVSFIYIVFFLMRKPKFS